MEEKEIEWKKELFWLIMFFGFGGAMMFFGEKIKNIIPYATWISFAIFIGLGIKYAIIGQGNRIKALRYWKKHPEHSPL